MLVSENISHENIHYRKLVVFEDNTCAVLVDGQEHFEVFANINETKNLVKVGVLAYLKNILRKNPTISKVISTAELTFLCLRRVVIVSFHVNFRDAGC